MTRAGRLLAGVAVGALALSLGVSPAVAQQGPADPDTGTLAVTGTVLVVPDEPLGSEPDAEHGGGGIWLATAHGPVIPLDERSLAAATDAPIAPGVTMDAVVELPAEAQTAVDHGAVDRAVGGAVDPAAGAAAQDSEAQMLEVAAQAVAEVDGGLIVSDAEVSAPAEASETMAAGSPHQADVVFFAKPGQTGVPSSDEISALMSRVSSYWKTQSNGLVDGIVSGTPRFRSLPSADICNPNAAWEKGAATFGTTLGDYAGEGRTRHLVALVLDPECGAGMGTMGARLNGGVVWANLEDYTPSRGAIVGTQTVAHEFGHNFGLEHANARTCTGSAVDARTASSGSAVAPCTDIEYGDLWNVMGVGIRGYTRTPAALTMSQRDYLGAAPDSAVLTLSPVSGSTHTVTLNALTADAGVRGIRIVPEIGDPFYVEYRNGSGQDAGMPQSSGTSVIVKRLDQQLLATTGVRVVKSLQREYGEGSTVLSRPSSGSFVQVMSARRSIAPHGSTAKVSVLSIDGASAAIRIDFADPFLPANAPTISGTARTGVTLAARVSAWAPQPDSVRVQWLRNGAPISGATATSFRLTSADAGARISVRVTGSRAGATATATSPQTSTVLRTLSTVKPTISGRAKAGAKLRLSRGTWKPSGITFRYQWLRNGKTITGATDTTYRLKSKDRGTRISVRVTGKKSGYATASRVSSSLRISRSTT